MTFGNYETSFSIDSATVRYIGGRAAGKDITNLNYTTTTTTTTAVAAAAAAITMMSATQVTSSDKTIADKQFYLMECERRFKKACEQIVHLNEKMGDLQFRYNKAWVENHRSFRYSIRMRIAVVEGLINMYYDYAHDKAYTIADLRRELFGENVQIIASDVSDSEYDGEH